MIGQFQCCLKRPASTPSLISVLHSSMSYLATAVRRNLNEETPLNQEENLKLVIEPASPDNPANLYIVKAVGLVFCHVVGIAGLIFQPPVWKTLVFSNLLSIMCGLSKISLTVN